MNLHILSIYSLYGIKIYFTGRVNMKFHQCVLKFVAFLLLMFSTVVFAASATSNIIFDVQAAGQKLESINQRLASDRLSIEYLSQSLNALVKLQAQAKECVKKAQANLDEVVALQKEVFPEAAEPVPAGALTDTQQYLINKKNEFSNRVLSCRLFVLQSQETITQLSVRIQKVSAQRLFRVTTPFYEKITASIHLFQDIKENFDLHILLEKSGVRAIIQPIFSITLIVALCFVSVFSVLLRRILKRKQVSCDLKDFRCQFRKALISTIRKYIFWFSCSLVFFIVSYALNVFMNKPAILVLISTVLLSYVSFLALAYFFFYPFEPQQTISGVTILAKPLLFRLRFLANLSFIGFIVYIILNGQQLTSSVVGLIRSVFITCLTISLMNILWFITRVKILQTRRLLCLTISSILTVILSLIMVVEWLGYQQLVNYVLRGIFLTMVFSFLIIVIHRMIKAVLKSSVSVRSNWLENLRINLGLGRYDSMLEFTLLRIVFYVVIWCIFFLILLKIWGFPQAHFRLLMSILWDGFSIAGLKIMPVRILFALLFFALSFTLIRWVKTSFEKRKDLKVSKGARSAIAALIGYLGIIFVLMLTLVIAGVRLAGLAVVAGALSVGIGFGLKDVVNNFISGIILLVERPIKIGDRVVINGIEGFVKRIHIRSTRIRTLEQTDLIVPNAAIISGQLINLSGSYAMVPIMVRVALGHDPELIKQLLLEVAKAHPQVIADDPNYEPWVFFTALDKEGLKFELYCVVPDVGVRYGTLSDLYFAISETFEKNKIEIALMQQDIHIKNWPILKRKDNT
jgi:potassium efflux system protein